MIGRLNHVAIATSDIKKAAKIYRDTLGATVSEEVPQPDHGVTTVFVDLGNTKIEIARAARREFAHREVPEAASLRRHTPRLL